MEFLPGRALKNSLFSLGITDVLESVLKEFDVELENLYELEPDAGLGNGGLGRLAACYLDGMATTKIPATGYSILYEYGIFKQKIVDGWQTELPDCWLPGGDVWLERKSEQAVEVHFGGHIDEWWDNGSHYTKHVGYTTVTAVAYDLYIAGYDSSSVSTLRLYKAQSPGVDMQKFNDGDYIGAFGATSVAETISKVLYPNDNHLEGKKLRLRQQYFLSSAAVSDIVRRHLSAYGTLENLAEQNAIQINDTHPVLAIPELMRILLDDCGFSWEKAFDAVSRTFAYTNHTVMAEALEVWNEELIKELLPRIHQIITEINRRFCEQLHSRGVPDYQVGNMAIISFGKIRMANLAVAVSHSINGVSKLHSQLITTDVFGDYYKVAPQKFKNVTNGIAARRWLNQANPELNTLITETIGEDFSHDYDKLMKFKEFSTDKKVLKKILAVKLENKKRLAKYLQEKLNISIPTNMIYDMQLKRLHEYKRQQLNALSIIADYQALKAKPEMDYVPRIHFFGAKAAPGYFLAKQIIKLLCTLGDLCAADPVISKKLRVVYVEDYSVSLSELLIPAADFSEQISLAGTEASGTGNMKFMLNGAITIGTLDGANVEICEAAGIENEIIFGLRIEEAKAVKDNGCDLQNIINNDPVLKNALNALVSGELGDRFNELYDALVHQDRYLTLMDFAAYREAKAESDRLYENSTEFATKSLINTACAGMFYADRAVGDYARDIWGI